MQTAQQNRRNTSFRKSLKEKNRPERVSPEAQSEASTLDADTHLGICKNTKDIFSSS